MEETKRIFSKIEDALEDFKSGRIVIVVDDADRENEGDFVCAAQCITEDTVNFMLSRGRGVLCAPLAPEVCDRLALPLSLIHISRTPYGRADAAHTNCPALKLDRLQHQAAGERCRLWYFSSFSWAMH